MQELKTFTEVVEHLNEIATYRYLRDDSGDIILDFSIGQKRKIHKVIPEQVIKEEIALDRNVPVVSAKLALENDSHGMHINEDQINWLPTVMPVTIERVTDEARKDYEKCAEIYIRETGELAEMFRAAKFRVVDVSKEKDCALEIYKKDTCVRIWIDLDEKNSPSYQAGYKENPFGRMRSCTKRPTLLRQTETIISKVIRGEIPTPDWDNRVVV